MTPIPSPLKTQPSADADSLAALGDTRRTTRLGLWSLLLGLGVLLLWAALAPIDEGVPAQGLVSIDTKRKAVQHPQGGIVREVRVHEGQMVQAGQVLMTLEPALFRANLESVRQHYHGLRAAEGRLLAEQRDQAAIVLHPDLQAARADPLVAQHIRSQEALFKSRRAALQASLSALDESLAGLQAQQTGMAAMLVQRQRQLALFKEEHGSIGELVREGYAPRNRGLELERNVAEVSSVVAELESGLQRQTRSIAELRQRMQLTRHEYRKEVDNQLADILREVQADAEKLQAVSQDMQRAELRAPAEGQVLGLSVQSAGAVVGPGQKLMDIVPLRALLLVEVRIPPHLIDRLKPGLLADIRFSAFAHSPQLVVEGQLLSISGDLLNDPETHQSYFLARAQVTPAGMQVLGARTMQAGMQAEVVIKTGQRSLLNYLSYPLVRRLSQAMKEE